MQIKSLPETERPYEKLQLHGEKALSNAELLAIIIKTGNREETSVQVAQKLLKLNTNIDKKENNLNFLRDLTIEEMTKLKGIGKVKAIQLKAVCELAVRMNTPSNYQQITIKRPEDVANMLMNDLRFLKQELVKVIILNIKNMVLKIVDISMRWK